MWSSKGRGRLPRAARTVRVAAALARAHSAAGAGLAVWVGGRLAGATGAGWWLLPMGVAFLLSAAGNAYNDAHDAPADRINRPHRPIPQGAATPAAARGLAFGCAALANLLALPFGPISVVGTAAATGLLFLYTTHLKKIPLVGNGMVGLLTGMALGYGGLLGGNVPIILLPAATLGLLFGARELLKTVHDLPGDRRTGLRTVATEVGPRRTVALASLCILAALGLLALWALSHPAGRWVLTVVGAVTLGLLLPLWRSPAAPTTLARTLRWSKVAGLLLLATFAVVG